ncbi:MAG TPA: T9SS type A sorting domain-containing protein [Chitinophagaceae bacterium]|nr:T9SS type A sorting domain-containing protein [Chitinophagaceae bacterium]
MKKFFTLSVFTGIVLVTQSQAVLNEFYPQPGAGDHEFFELYNEYNSLEYLDNYTMVVYYEEPVGKSGFYVLDFPNDSIAAHGYYVGATQTPFDIQLQNGLTADFSWNAMPAGGSLTKWELNGSSYTSVPVPANLNDLFVRIGGAGGVYHVFLYKNGILVNGVIGGVNATVVPGYLEAMPALPVDMSGSSPDFTIDFNAIPDNSLEYIPNSVGTNNGYFRSSDGLCGEWLKSDSPGQHNPGQTNGSSLSIGANQLSIAAVISQYMMEPTKSLLTYNISSAPAGAFPAVVEVYCDLGISGQWDINDTLIDIRTILSASAGNQYVILPTWDVAVIVVVKSASDCYNKNIAVGNYFSVLPVELISFTGNIKNNRAALQWRVGNNETIDQFEVQRSTDGKEFNTIGLVLASEKRGTEDYMSYETVNADQVMYRLKMIGKGNEVSYSRIIVFQTKITKSNIKIIGNPVQDELTFNYTTLIAEPVEIKIYDMQGRILMNNKVNSLEGNNMISFPLASGLKRGMYLLKVTNGTETQTTKFVKY